MIRVSGKTVRDNRTKKQKQISEGQPGVIAIEDREPRVLNGRNQMG
jgi:hypothetical protein